eukprot:11401559-Alexandrium_andersonii.AAC.1
MPGRSAEQMQQRRGYARQSAVDGVAASPLTPFPRNRPTCVAWVKVLQCSKEPILCRRSASSGG